MDYLKAALLLIVCSTFITGCGEELPSETPEGAQNPSQNSSWIIGTWSGVQTVQRAGKNASTASVQMKFFADQTYQLSFPGQSSNYVQGKYAVNPQGTLLLKVEQSSAKLYVQRSIPESFRYTYQRPLLQIFNKEVRLDLQFNDNVDEPEETDETNESLFSLFDSWTCFDDKHLWKISIFEDESFYLRRYKADNRLPAERAGKLASYTETPKLSPEEKKAHIVFYLDSRKLNLVFKITSKARSLKVEYFQGSIAPGSPDEINCFR